MARQGPMAPGNGEWGGGGIGRLALTFRTFDSLRNPGYRLYWGAMIGQYAAMNMQMVAGSWFMYKLTQSPIMLGAVSLANAVPMLILSLYGGVIADRVPKKNILVVGQAAAALIALGIALSISIGAITWVHLLAAAFLQGVIMALKMPSNQAIIPEIVGEAGLMNAVALSAAAMNLNRVLAPATAGFLIAGIGIAGVYYAMSGLYLFSGLLFLLLPRTGTIAIRGRGALEDMKAGIQYIRQNRIVLALLALNLGVVVLSMPYVFLLPIFTEDILAVGPRGLGVLMSVSGIGAVVGSLLIASLGNQRRGALYLYSVLAMGVALLVFSFSRWWFLSLGAIIPVGIGQAGRWALSNILLQAYTQEAYRGRVMSIYMMEWGVTSVGTFFIAILAEFVGVQWAIGGTSMLLVVLICYAYALMPRLRRLQ